MSETIHCNAFAKVNLNLNILGKRADGYHEIQSVMQAVGLADQIKVEATPHRKGTEYIRVTVEGDDRVPEGRGNLAYQAAEAMMDVATLPEDSAILIHIKKNIPMAAGLAGGSSDAAAVILAMERLYESNLDMETLLEVGAGLGADIPFCLGANANANGMDHLTQEGHCTVLAEGIGDKLSPLTSPGGYFILCHAPIEVSTQDIYRAFDAGDYPGVVSKTEVLTELLNPIYSPVSTRSERLHAAMSIQFAGMMGLLKAQSFGVAQKAGPEFPRNMQNALQAPAVDKYPIIGGIIDLMKDILNADAVFMTGSGPTVAAYYLPKKLKTADGDMKRLKKMLEPRGITCIACPIL
jgi:4-diphosphocytidyl-2-C-methyl-D-erythritol kinase